MPKTGQELSREFDDLCGRESSKRVLLWEIFQDVLSSVELALEDEGMDDLTQTALLATVEDYLANNYGA